MDWATLYGVKPMMTEMKQIVALDSADLKLEPAVQSLIDLRDRPSPDVLRVLAIGSPQVVNCFVMTLFQYGYARPEEWSRQLPTVNPGEVMRILTKRINLAD
ncbi:MAG: hypothetical protein HC881_20455 [Leptolyngbyaceae cyanobacterium SL_7_1]|nr:hypothetical protein [Leptolyngbyaceae cyanobacterium SL_7_1]